MPGTPDPVLGSSLLTTAVCLVAAAAAVALAYRFRDAANPRTLAVAGGVGYAAVALGLWFVVSVATNEFAQLSAPWLQLAAIALASGLVVAVHTGLALNLYARFGYLTPLAVLFGATHLLAWLFLNVGGETDPIALYWVLFGPVVLAVLLVLAGAEYGVRAVLGA